MSDINLTKKQSECFNYLTDNDTETIIYGGSIGSGKSFILCVWISYMCITYPGTRYLIGRYFLQNLKLTTLKTLFEVLSMMGLDPEKHYTFNGSSNVITFYNKSEIILKDLAPSLIDPEYTRLGSHEYTAVAVDEIAEIPELAYNMLKSRIRFKLKQYNLKGKILGTTNPTNNWIKRQFYLPYIEERLPNNVKFVPALPGDNPHLPQSYLESINNLPRLQRERLVLSNWNYMDDGNDILFTYEDVIKSYHLYDVPNTGNFYASCDVSRFGSDRSVLVIWKELCIVEINIYEKLDTVKLTDKIKERMVWYKIPSSRTVIDSDGVGAGATDVLRAKGFVNNSSPLYGENYTNLKSQCYYTLSDKIKKGEISFNISEPELMDKIVTELMVVKMKDVDKDKKLAIISKDDMKLVLGESPDIADSIMMGMIFHIENTKNKPTGKYNINFL